LSFQPFSLLRRSTPLPLCARKINVAEYKKNAVE
jgi:hypothetical protein